jgi:hypothetical protein
MMTRHLVFHMYVEEYTTHKVMSQFGLYQVSLDSFSGSA